MSNAMVYQRHLLTPTYTLPLIFLDNVDTDWGRTQGVYRHACHLAFLLTFTNGHPELDVICLAKIKICHSSATFSVLDQWTPIVNVIHIGSLPSSSIVSFWFWNSPFSIEIRDQVLSVSRHRMWFELFVI